MTKLEQIARAICVADGEGPEWWRAYNSHARAAVEAMREPSEAMCMAGANFHMAQAACATEYGYEAEPKHIGEAYTAMISAILNEKP